MTAESSSRANCGLSAAQWAQVLQFATDSPQTNACGKMLTVEMRLFGCSLKSNATSLAHDAPQCTSLQDARGRTQTRTPKRGNFACARRPLPLPLCAPPPQLFSPGPTALGPERRPSSPGGPVRLAGRLIGRQLTRVCGWAVV